MTKSTSRNRALPWLVLAAILIFALNLRGPIVAPAPVLGLIRDDLNMSGPVAGLLTGLTVLCFGVFTPLASGIIHRAGPNQAVLLTLLGVLAGTVVRSAGGQGLAIAGTIIMGAAITIGNVVVPVVIRRNFPPRRVGIATGAYTAALNVGSMITALLTAPLAAVVGWRLALILWAALALVAAVVWLRAVGWREPAVPDPAAEAPGSAPDGSAALPAAGAGPAWRSPIAWVLLFAFAGQAFSYYAVTAWLPTMLRDVAGQGLSAAGASSSLFQIFAIAGALAVPVLVTRIPTAAVVALVGACWAALPVGMILSPALWAIWCSSGGAAQGGGITVIFIMLVRLSRTDAHARALSALVQGGGYLIGATGPLVIGALYDLTQAWLAPMLVVLAAVLVLAGGGIGAAASMRRNRQPSAARG